MEQHVIKMPSLGEDVSQGTVVNIRVSAGSNVKAGDILLEVETDKVVVEVPADSNGVVAEMLLKEGQKVGEGAEILRFKTGAAAEASTETEGKTATAKPPVPENAPAKVEKADLVGSETAQAAVDTASLEENIEKAEAVAESMPQPVSEPAPSGTPPSNDGYIKAGPAVRRMSRELGVDLNQVNGTGDRNSIKKEDIKDHVREALQNASAVATGGAAAVNNASQRAGISAKPMPDLSQYGDINVVQATAIQTATANNMVHSWSTVPHAWLQERIDITDLEASRKKFVSKVKSSGGAFTITVLLVKAIARVMKEIPIFNAAYDDINGQIIYRNYCDIGVAIDTEKGLVVPTLRSVDKKSLTDIAIDFTELTMRTKKRKITAKDLSGGGFTLSNLKGMSVSGIFPIINWPQTAILGVADSDWVQVLRGNDPTKDAFEPRLIMPVTIGFDHRIINGGDAARFLKMLKETLQDPMAMLL